MPRAEGRHSSVPAVVRGCEQSKEPEPTLEQQCPEPLWTSLVSGAKPTPEHEDASASGVVPTELYLVSLLLVTKV